jgi:poly-gamma-glutamate capsule biosynthesis protein CapA/YwtB (metallophosphatase superfamily)
MTARVFCCGDVGPLTLGDGTLAEPITPFLKQADIRFAQCERMYSLQGRLASNSNATHARCAPELAQVFFDCGFDVVSLASNHTLNYGAKALADTINLFRSRGVQTVGAGMNISEARKPAFLEVAGQRIAFLAYASVLREGFEATKTSAGAAPLRVRTWHEEFDWQPGMPPLTRSEVWAEDLEEMCTDISAAKKQADHVIVSQHWGIHYIPRLIAEYQPPAARAAIAAGADAIIGSHAHAPKAIEIIDGKPCFYSLGNFMMSGVPKTGDKARLFEEQYGVKLDPSRPFLPYGQDARRLVIAELNLSQGSIEAGLHLGEIGTDMKPRVFNRGAAFDEALQFLKFVSDGYGTVLRSLENYIAVEQPRSISPLRTTN